MTIEPLSIAELEALAVPAYGTPGTWLLPAALRNRFGTRALAPALIDAIGAEKGVLWAEARFGPADRPQSLRNVPATAFMTGIDWADPAVLTAPILCVADLSSGVCSDALALMLNGPSRFNGLPLRTRTRGVLSRQLLGRLGWSIDDLAEATLGDLLAVRGAGPLTALDAAVVLEAAINALAAADYLNTLGVISARDRPSKTPETATQLPRVLTGPLPEWAMRIHGNDPRFADLLPCGRNVAEMVADTNLAGGPEAVAQVLVGRVHRLDGLAIENLMGEYLDELRMRIGRRQAPDMDCRWHQALVTRLGIGGLPPSTLDEAGGIAGCTRERVRQVEAKLLAARPDDPVWLPAVERSIALVAAATPIRDAQVGPLLAEAGLASPTMTPASLLAAADFGRLNVRAFAPKGLAVANGWVVTDSTAAAVGALRVAARHTSKFGLTTVREVTLALDDGVAKIRDVERVLRDDLRVHFTSDGWLWVDKPDNQSMFSNSLRNAARAILSVNAPQTVGSIHEGFRRSQKFRQRDIVPTRVAVGEFLAAHPEFVVDVDSVESVTRLDYHDVLGPVAAHVVDVLKSSPYGVMDRASMVDAVVDAGVSLATITVWTTYAEWIEHFAPNIWGLRGARVGPGVIDALKQSARRRTAAEPHERGWSWTPTGNIAVVARVTTNFWQSGVVTIGPDLRRTLGASRFAAQCASGPCGELAIAEDHDWLWGWGRFMRALEVKIGQVVRAELNPGTGAAVLTVGGAELLSEIT